MSTEYVKDIKGNLYPKYKPTNSSGSAAERVSSGGFKGGILASEYLKKKNYEKSHNLNMFTMSGAKLLNTESVYDFKSEAPKHVYDVGSFAPKSLTSSSSYNSSSKVIINIKNLTINDITNNVSNVKKIIKRR